MKKTTICISLLFGFSAYLHGQKVNLNWQGTETVDYGFTKMTYPKFSNKGYSVEGGSVYVSLRNSSNGKGVKIDNLQWKTISRKDILDIPDDILGSGTLEGVSYYTDPKTGQEFYDAKISAFKKEGDVLYQLQSFEIVDDVRTGALAGKSLAQKLGTTENPLNNGTFYKIKVDKSGLFKIDKKFLSDNGINVGNINPKHFKIYGNGGIILPEHNEDERFSSLQELAIQVIGEDDGVWNDGDYALFYAQGTDGYNLYGTFGNGNKRKDSRTDRSAHTKNIYDDYSYYFINFDNGVEGKRIQNSDIAISGTTFTRFDDYQFVDNDKYNLMKVGRVWVDDHFSTKKSITFNLRSAIQPNDEITYRTSVVNYNGGRNSFKVDINNTNERSSGTLPEREFYQKTDERTVKNLSGNSITINISPNTAANPNGLFYFDYAEVTYKEDLKFNGSQMNFRAFDIDEKTNNNYGFSISDASQIEQVWDVSDITNAKRKVNKSGNNTTFSFGYNAGNPFFNNEFIAFKSDSAYTPSFVGRIANQDLHSLQNIDYLIITRADMMAQGERIAQYYRDKKGFSTQVVDIEKIYNEFSSGRVDITAVRDFITRLHKERGGVKYVLIIGDTSYDYKDKTKGNDNIIPSYQSEFSGNYSSSFVTDDYFVMTAPQGKNTSITNNIPEIPIGRLIASNVSEAKLLVDKTLAYYNALPGQSSPFGDWKMKLDFIVDDNNEGGPAFHEIVDESIKTNFETGIERKEYNVRKLYIDAFQAETVAGGQRYPQVNQAIANDVGHSLYLFYFGHGGINGWAQERILTSDEVKNFNNYSSIYNRFPFISTITCEFTLWDEPLVNSVGEQVIKHPNGGAANMITSSRAIGVHYGSELTKIFTNHIFKITNNNFDTLGDAFLAARKKKGVSYDHLKVNLLGDPAMTLSRPNHRLSIDNIETPESGKIRALDFVKISGRVLDGSGNTDANFNGKVSISIFDKKVNKETKNNDGNLGTMQYTEENAAIVKTSGKVANGLYTAEFYMPKDINYTLGEGRILAYADNFESAKGNAYDVYENKAYPIGEINPNPINDATPPTVKLYMNNTNFADGGITHQNPTLLACITDNIGINSAGSGIGHDISLVLDGQVVNTVVLNDFYTAGEGNGCINPSLADYQKGSISYPLRNLKPGAHQLTFKVWDINNNSSTTSLNFVVKDDAEANLTINRPLNWPNPFTDKTYIQFEHNCDDILDVNVQIYTITGKLVRTFSTTISAEPFREGFRTPKQAIEWDGTDDFGDTVAKGTYIFKILAKSKNQNKCKGTASAIEKMVLLK